MVDGNEAAGFRRMTLDERRDLLEGLGELVEKISDRDRAVAREHAERATLIDRASRDATLLEDALVPTEPGYETSPVRRSEMARRAFAAELSAALHIPQVTAQRLIHESESLVNTFTATHMALSDGDISYQHARVIIDQADSLDAGAAQLFEEVVLPHARRMTVSAFRGKARKMREKLHPDSITERTEIAIEDRHVEFEPASDGMAWISLYQRADLAQAMHMTARQKATSLKNAGDDRTFSQLVADVLADSMLAGLAGEPADPNASAPASRIIPTVFVTVPVLSLLGYTEQPATLDGYGPISPTMAKALAARAPSFTRILTNVETGAVLSVGRDRYAVPADLRKALITRDGTCRGVNCNRSAVECDADHTHEWHEGGETALTNLASLCPSCHALKTETAWDYTIDAEGYVTWTSPLGNSVTTAPQNAFDASPRGRHPRGETDAPADPDSTGGTDPPEASDAA